MRLQFGPNKYKHKSLKPEIKALAIKASEDLCFEMEFKAQHGIPIDAKPFGEVDAENVEIRRKEHEQIYTSTHKMRHIERVAQF